MSENERLVPPTPSAEDAAHTLTKAVLSCAPVVGGPIVELFNTVFSPSIEKRKYEWMKEVANEINELKSRKGLNPDDLRNNESFIDVVLQATQIYLRTSQEKKKVALKNVIFNSPLPEAPSKSIQQIFLSILDSISDLHFQLLYLFDDPIKWANERNHKFPDISMGGISNIIFSAYPDLKNEDELIRMIWRDLYNKGLFNIENSTGTMSYQGLVTRRTSDFGRGFVNFITK